MYVFYFLEIVYFLKVLLLIREYAPFKHFDP